MNQGNHSREGGRETLVTEAQMIGTLQSDTESVKCETGGLRLDSVPEIHHILIKERWGRYLCP